MAAWVRLNSKAANMGLFTNDDYGANERNWNLYYDQAADRFKAQKFIGDGLKTLTCNTFGSPATGVDYFIAISFDYVLDLLTVTINDVSESIETTGWPEVAATLRIGGFTNNGVGADWWNGVIGDVMYFDRALTEAELTRLYNGGRGMKVVGGTTFPEATFPRPTFPDPYWPYSDWPPAS